MPETHSPVLVYAMRTNEDVQIEIAVDASLHSVMELWFITRQKRDITIRRRLSVVGHYETITTFLGSWNNVSFFTSRTIVPFIFHPRKLAIKPIFFVNIEAVEMVW